MIKAAFQPNLHKGLLPRIALLCIALFSAYPVRAENPAADDITLRVMTFNIEWGGTHVSFDQVIEAINRAEPDIVGIQEAEGNLSRLASELGWNHDERNYVLSRFPLIDPQGADGYYVLVETVPGKAVAMSNLHLPSDPYGPDMVRDGSTLTEVLHTEQTTRMPELAPYLEALPALAGAGFPVILTGDFNSPAHTDWTPGQVGSRKFLDYAVEWPVSRALADAGFKDAWREVYPDVNAHPGLTWWAGRPPIPRYGFGDNDARDRIDHLWFAGPVTARSASIAGERGGPEVSIEVEPWPSDHRAVVAEFRVTPAPLPAFLTTRHRVYEAGSHATVRYRHAGEDDVEIILSGPDDSRMSYRFPANPRSGEWDVHLPLAGAYSIGMQSRGRTLERQFWALEPGAVPKISTEKSVFDEDEDIEVSWQNAPGFRNDYIAVYREGALDLEADLLGWAYLSSLPHGRIRLRNLPDVDPQTLVPGRYVLHLMKDDGIEPMAKPVTIEIRARE